MHAAPPPTGIMLEGREIPLNIRRHARARRISLRLSAARDGVILTLPLRASVASGMKFLTQKAGWVLAHVEEAVSCMLADGQTVPVFGQPRRIRRLPGRGTGVVTADEVLVYGDPAFTPRRVRDCLTKAVHAYCETGARELSARLEKTVRAVRVRDMRSRWGSCTRDGRLAFHWQLAFAPLPVLDYLIAHEVAHLAEMNHGKSFWNCVEWLCPDYLSARSWLKRHGHELHRYRP